MMPTKNLNTTALCIILFFTAFTITHTKATTENNYKNDNNFLTNISEIIRAENGYKTNIIINPTIVGICAQENGYKLDLAINTQGIGSSLKENSYKLDLIPEKAFLDNPDIAITKIVTSKTVVGQGYTALINITVSNRALNYEIFHIIVRANTTVIKTQTVTLTNGTPTTLTFTWNTTGFAKGNYTISAYAQPVLNEIFTTDNNFTDGFVIVSMVGDICSELTSPYHGWPDGRCDMSDLYPICKLFGVFYPNSKYIANCDVDNDMRIDMGDVYIVAKQFGKIDP